MRGYVTAYRAEPIGSTAPFLCGVFPPTDYETSSQAPLPLDLLSLAGLAGLLLLAGCFFGSSAGAAPVLPAAAAADDDDDDDGAMAAAAACTADFFFFPPIRSRKHRLCAALLCVDAAPSHRRKSRCF